ncbi:MAG: hypothetical protein GX086_12755 [Alcaligenaceae bacterium]|nr:hypothetical protein [Alcaligenaceae bacterium]
MTGSTKEQKSPGETGEAQALELKAIELSGLDAEGFAALSDDERAKLIEQAKAAEEPKATKGRQAKASESHLVAMRKGGEGIKVHPSCVEAHRRQGWAQE